MYKSYTYLLIFFKKLQIYKIEEQKLYTEFLSLCIIFYEKYFTMWHHNCLSASTIQAKTKHYLYGRHRQRDCTVIRFSDAVATHLKIIRNKFYNELDSHLDIAINLFKKLFTRLGFSAFLL